MAEFDAAGHAESAHEFLPLLPLWLRWPARECKQPKQHESGNGHDRQQDPPSGKTGPPDGGYVDKVKA
jgi:hypothetical protein